MAKDNTFAEADGLLKSNDNTDKENDDLKVKAEFYSIFTHWKNYPGQDAKNEPNLRKQAQMLIHLYHHKAMRAADLFSKTGVGGVTGARYIATLKKFGLINYIGARKKGQYKMTQKGIDFVETSIHLIEHNSPTFSLSDSSKRAGVPGIDQQGVPVKDDVKDVLTSYHDDTNQ